MSVPVAYATIIIIWSTTPLAIQWSSETITPISAVTLRMLSAAAIGYAILRLFKIKLSWTARAIKVYAASLLGVFLAMLCTYIAAAYVPSGIISVIYALSPVISNLLSHVLIGSAKFTRARWFAFGISFSGLLLIFKDDWVVMDKGWFGLLLLLLAVSLYSLGGVLVEKQKFKAHPLSITVGTLLLSVPLFIAAWFVMDGQLPYLDWGTRSPWSVLYLAIAGSLLGFACYFFIIKELGATAVAMVTLMTPVFALALGAFFNGEHISEVMLIGTACILSGLVLYYWSASERKLDKHKNSESVEVAG